MLPTRCFNNSINWGNKAGSRMLHRTLQQLLLVATVATTSCSLAQSASSLVNTECIARLLRQAGIAVTAEQVSLPTPVPVRHEGTAIEILSIAAMDRAHSRIRLRCRETAECLPFYAVLQGTFPAVSQRGIRQQERLPGSREVTRPASDGPWLVRSGERATLLLEGIHVHIHLPVICLNNGRAGNMIQVATTDHKRIYRAQVSGAGLVKGGL